MTVIRTLSIGAVAFTFSSASALAHISLKEKQARIGTDYRAVLRVPHGCAGKPTDTVRVRVPEGIIAVKPETKPGWAFETVETSYRDTYSYQGETVDRGITEIRWTGGSLDDKAYDEFVFDGFVASELTPGTTLYVPVVQLCGDEAERWIELPAQGQKSEDLKYPAPGVILVPK